MYNQWLTRLKINSVAVRNNSHFLHYGLYQFFYVKVPFIKMYFTGFKTRHIEETINHVRHLVHLCICFVDDIGGKSISTLFSLHGEHLHIRFNGSKWSF